MGVRIQPAAVSPPLRGLFPAIRARQPLHRNLPRILPRSVPVPNRHLSHAPLRVYSAVRARSVGLAAGVSRQLPAFCRAMGTAAEAKRIGTLGPLVWIDMEATGLDVYNDQIIEICCMITDADLNLLDDVGYESVVHCSKAKMDAMDEWCVTHHGQSGLTAKVIASTRTMAEVEAELLAYIKKYVPTERLGILAGNSVHMDKEFMRKDMPSVVQYLHYRLVDVSTISELGKRRIPQRWLQRPPKTYAHTAKSDILESIAELQWYYDNWLVAESDSQNVV
ncbi:uncharacterized protein V1510DRAFT_422567 [Dipodascopsis tothii]|uniref:uncharacterized protein n=1 Tax=Dipodascopsis tothii TaxID=44089 RepID=UPI0034CECBA7